MPHIHKFIPSHIYSLLLLTVAILSVFSPVLAGESSPETSDIRGGYWLSWLAQNFPPSAISTSHFTHLFYAFLEPNNVTFELIITPNDDQWMRNFTSTIHAVDSQIKTILSIGGGGSSVPIFSAMAATQTTRSAFIASTISNARFYGFDGLDLDWEFPNSTDDMSNLSLLFQEWRQAIETESSSNIGRAPLSLSAAVSYASSFQSPPRSYPADAITKFVDFVSPMCFDYFGKWTPSATGSQAQLFDKTSNLSTSYGVNSWIEAGVPPEKLVMGLPVYGRTWRLKNGCDHGIGAPAEGVGPGNDGVMIYSDVLDFNSANGATVVFDTESVSTYSFAGTTWIGYDGPSSIDEKVKFAKAHGLRGYFFWALGYDKNWTIAETGRFLNIL
uniref:GH18 domain-containing protein n=1 Tax=Cucumis sativus TaxID=3659 RepID=A0A0A0LZ13_CUCSA